MKKMLLFILSFSVLFICPITVFAKAETYTEEYSLLEEATITEDMSFNFNIMEFFSELDQFETPEALNKMSRVSQAFFIIIAIAVLIYIVYKMYKGSRLQEIINNYKKNKNKTLSNTNEMNDDSIEKNHQKMSKGE